jgi:hypothetical protein
MTHKFRQMLVALSVLGSATIAFGCNDSRSSMRTFHDGYSDNPTATKTSSFTPLSPEQSILSDAANPLGWADRAERCAAEDAFARGEDSPIAPPNAIGGGPSLDD